MNTHTHTHTHTHTRTHTHITHTHTQTLHTHTHTHQRTHTHTHTHITHTHTHYTHTHTHTHMNHKQTYSYRLYFLLFRSSCEQSAGSCGGHQPCLVGLPQSRHTGRWRCYNQGTWVNNQDPYHYVDRASRKQYKQAEIYWALANNWLTLML